MPFDMRANGPSRAFRELLALAVKQRITFRPRIVPPPALYGVSLPGGLERLEFFVQSRRFW